MSGYDKCERIVELLAERLRKSGKKTFNQTELNKAIARWAGIDKRTIKSYTDWLIKNESIIRISRYLYRLPGGDKATQQFSVPKREDDSKGVWDGSVKSWTEEYRPDYSNIWIG